MKTKFIPILCVFIFLVALASCLVLASKQNFQTDTIKLNEIKNDVEQSAPHYNLDITDYNIIVINTNGVVLYSTNKTSTAQTYDQWINYAYKNNLIIMDFSLGKIFVAVATNNIVTTAIVTIAVVSALLILIMLTYYFYLWRNMFVPFKNLEEFADEIAIGNFEKPLPMDKSNMFGAFSESFDIMREELKKSKQKEIALEKSKNELVAQLSHDIKTPVASIKAVTEVLKIKEDNTKNIQNFDIILQKATDIDNLITDMFNLTLQDLTELNINLDTYSASEVKNIVAKVDYLNKINDFTVPDCFLNIDLIRLSQVIGNIINNSYKYADTQIDINTEIFDNVFAIEFRDFGTGVSNTDIELITNKFYRGANAENKDGAGLGLYICKNLLTKMGGDIDCYNTKDGFAVKIFLMLA